LKMPNDDASASKGMRRFTANPQVHEHNLI
jgi:hypothetical protein